MVQTGRLLESQKCPRGHLRLFLLGILAGRHAEDTRDFQRLDVIRTPEMDLPAGGYCTRISSRVARNALEFIVGSFSGGTMFIYPSEGRSPKPHARQHYMFVPLEGFRRQKSLEHQMPPRGFAFDQTCGTKYPLEGIFTFHRVISPSKR